MIQRYLENVIRQHMDSKKAVVIMGARQVGKTTLIKSMFANESAIWLNGDDPQHRSLLDNLSAESAKRIIGNKSLLIIDEAQRIENIGLKLKILYDNFSDRMQIVATGSSSLDLAGKINEPMTGRKLEYQIHPVSFSEMVASTDLATELGNLENRMIYGYYPGVVSDIRNARNNLTEIAESYLYKDVLQMDGIAKPNKLTNLVKALALQIGSQVSINELSDLVGIDNKTVDKYLSLLEKSYIIFHLSSYSNNLRNEIRFSNKYYFYDIGIRNAVLRDFRPIADRNDVGGMFENFIIAEMQKASGQRWQYFWRTKQQQEVDYLVEQDSHMVAAEIKWNEKRNPRLPKTFMDKYKPSEVFYVNRANFYEYLLKYQTQIIG